MIRLNNKIKNIYIHIPFCIKKCFFCAFPIHAVGQRTDQVLKQKMYTQYCTNLQRQIETIIKKSNYECNKLQSIYFGGGTPSLLSKQQIKSILRYFQPGIDINTQITMEVNPQQLNKVEGYFNIGVNRFSVGVQTLNSGTLSHFNRGYKSQNQTNIKSLRDQLIYISRNLNANLNIDFILNLNDKQKDKQQMMNLISDVKPKHLSIYLLEVNEGSYLHRNQNQRYFKQAINNYEHFQQICSQLVNQHQYKHYQVSNFCHDGYQSKQNQAYWKGTQQFGAFGMGAASLLNGFRVTRPKNLSKYYEYVQKLETDFQKIQNSKLLQLNDQRSDQQKLKWIVLSRLRCKQGISWSLIISYLEKIDSQYYKEKVQKCKEALHQLNRLSSNIIDVNSLDKSIRLIAPKGYLYADQVGYKVIDAFNI